MAFSFRRRKIPALSLVAFEVRHLTLPITVLDGLASAAQHQRATPVSAIGAMRRRRTKNGLQQIFSRPLGPC